MDRPSSLISPFRKISLLLLGVAAFCLLRWILLPQLLHVPVPDESTFLYEGWRVSQGAVPYRDFFEFIGPGTLYTVALCIKLFGFSILALRLSTVVVVALCCVLSYRLSRLILPAVWRWAYIVFMATVYLPLIVVQHHLYSALTTLLAVWLLFRYLEKPEAQKRSLWFSGFMTGLTVLYTQSLGGLIAISLSGFLVLYFSRGHWRQIPAALLRTGVQFLLPFLIPVLLTVCFFATQQALPELTYDMFGWLMEGRYAQTTSSWYMLEGFTKITSFGLAILRNPWLTFTHPDYPITLLVVFLEGFLPVLGLLWALQVGWQRLPRVGLRWVFERFNTHQWQFCMLVLVALAFFMANFSYPTSVLISYHGWIYDIFAFAALFSLSRQSPWLKKLTILTLSLLLSIRLGTMGVEAWQAYRTPGILSYGTTEKMLSPLNYTPEGVQSCNQMLRYLHENSPPGHNLFVYNGAPELYLLTSRINPTRYQLLMALYNTPAQIHEVVEDLKAKKPTFIIYNQQDKLNFERDLRFLKVRQYDYRLSDIEALLNRDYVLAAQLGNQLLFRRLDTEPMGARP